MPKKVETKEDVWTLAVNRMREAFTLFDTVAVSFSGGKDSTCVLQVTLAVAREIGWGKKIPVVFWDEEAIPYETEHYVRRVAEEHRQDIDLIWLCLPIKHRNGCSRTSPYWYTWAPEDREKWVRPLPPEGVTTWPQYPQDPKDRLTIPDCMGLIFRPEEWGQVGIALGIRSQESLTRLRIILRGASRERVWMVPWAPDAELSQLQLHNVTKIYPIYDWRTEDVWTAPKRFGWDYNRAYDVMAKIGMAPLDQRCAPPYGEEPMRGLWTFAVCFPDIWDQMQRRVPGAATAARYANTSLYGFGSAMTRLPGKTWKETVKHYIQKHDRKTRKAVAHRIEREILRHYSLTKDPLVGHAIHPLSGICWQWLVMLANRGDLKGRRQGKIVRWHEPENKATVAAWKRYREEQATWNEEE